MKKVSPRVSGTAKASTFGFLISREIFKLQFRSQNSHPMPRKYNLLKIRALGIFENRGWLSPPAWAILASFYPVRAAYSYLKRLHRWKLLDRTLDRRGLLLYRLSRRGVDRLHWLRSRTTEGGGLT
jgi:hypothetical protein